MNTRLLAALAFTTAILAPKAAASINAYTVNFNDNAATYTGNFLRYGDDSTMTGLTWGAAVGTNGGGGLTVTEGAARNLFYRPNPTAANATSTFNISAQAANTTFTSTLDFQWGSTTATTQTLITAGFVPSNTSQTALTSSGALAGSLIRTASGSIVTLRMRNGTANAGSTLDFNQSALTAGNWYRLSYELTKTAVTNTFDYTVSLFSIGATGTSTASLFNDGSKNITLSGSVTNSAIYADTDAFFAYDIRGDANGVSRVDNFSVATSAVPEPSTYALVAGFLAVGFAASRRGGRSRA